MATIAVEYGVNEEDALYLPCRDSELEEVLRAVNAGSSNEITIINVMWPEGLRMLNGLTVDADEMNFLAKRMDSFVPMELMKFIAAASVINDMDTCKLINLSFNTERYTLVQDVTDLAQIGKMRYMSIHGTTDRQEKLGKAGLPFGGSSHAGACAGRGLGWNRKRGGGGLQ